MTDGPTDGAPTKDGSSRNGPSKAPAPILPARVASGEPLGQELRRVLADDTWFVDVTSRNHIAVHRIGDFHISRESRFQQIDVFESPGLGRCLVLDGRIQLADADEFVYHEMLVHPAMVLGAPVRRAVVLGGGDGCAVRELVRWRSLERVQLVDIDEELVRVLAREVPQWSAGSFDDPRSELHFEDAARFLRGSDDPLDLVIGDLTEPFDETGIAGDLSADVFERELFDVVRGRLRSGGIFAVQTGGIQCKAHLDRHHARLVRRVRSVFAHTLTLYEFVPSFAELWTVTLASDEPFRVASAADVDAELQTAGVGGLRYYDGSTHGRLTTTPRFVRDLYSQP